MKKKKDFNEHEKEINDFLFAKKGLEIVDVVLNEKKKKTSSGNKKLKHKRLVRY